LEGVGEEADSVTEASENSEDEEAIESN